MSHFSFDMLDNCLYYQSMVVDIIVGLAILLFVALGLARGFVKSMVMLVKIPMTIGISFFLAAPLASFLNTIGFLRILAGWIGSSIELTGIISVIALAVIIFVAIRVILHKLVKKSDQVKERRKFYNRADRILGVVFGLAQFIVIFTLISILFAAVNWLFTQVGVNIHGMVFSGSYVALWLYDLILSIASSFF